MKNLVAALLLGALCLSNARAQAIGGTLLAPGSRMVLDQNWMIQSSAKVGETGSVISTARFQPHGWYPAHIPSTVLATLVKNRVYPNPDYGMNLRSIPGTTYPIGANFANLPMPSESPFRVGWWFRTQFHLPSSTRGKMLSLHFDGINNSANIWLNGHPVANTSQVNGMRRHYEFNITDWAAPGQGKHARPRSLCAHSG